MTARHIDENGFLTVDGCPITREGVFDYSAAQVGLRDGDPNRIVKVYRPASEINKPDFINSIRNIPLIDDHTLLDGSGDANEGVAPEKVGIEGTTTSEVAKGKDGWIRAGVKLFTQRIKRLLDSGKKDLSLGYSCSFEPAKGVFQGQPYEFIQRMRKANHLALVDAARVSGAHVLDSKLIVAIGDSDKGIPGETYFDVKERIMPENEQTGGGGAVEELRQLIPQVANALEAFLSQEASEPEHKQGAVPAAQQPASQDNENPQTAMQTPPQAAAPAQDNNAELMQLLQTILARLSGNEQAAAEPVANPAPQQEGGAEPNVNEGDNMEQHEADALEGLAEGGKEGEHELNLEGAGVKTGDEETAGGFSGHNGKASKGPGEGKHVEGHAGDAALRAFYKDSRLKDQIYGRLSNVVGPFDHSRMTAGDMAMYGAKKIGLKVKSIGDAAVALDSYLKGMEVSARAVRANFSQSNSAGYAGDSSAADASGLSAYLNGGK